MQSDKKDKIIIGKNGADIEALRNDIKKLVKNDQVVVNIYEVRRPDLNAQLVAQNIAQQIEGRVSFKRAMKKAVQNAQKVGALGIKFCFALSNMRDTSCSICVRITAE